MIYHDSETRSLLARERAELLAHEMRAARRPAGVESNGSRPHPVRALLTRLRRPAWKARHEAAAYEA
jgi:hypothetical protein